MYGAFAATVHHDEWMTRIVERDDRKIVLLPAFVVRTKDVAADAAIAVDCNFDGHYLGLQKNKNILNAKIAEEKRGVNRSLASPPQRRCRR